MSEENVKEKKEEVVINEAESNNIQISDDVVAVIAGMAVSDVPGVADMAGGFAGGISEVLSGKKNMSKGIKVDIQEKSVKVDVNIIVEYGARIPEVAFEIQKRVKKAVEEMTGLVVNEVNVHVQGVSTSESKKEEIVEVAKTEKTEVKKVEKKDTKVSSNKDAKISSNKENKNSSKKEASK